MIVRIRSENSLILAITTLLQIGLALALPTTASSPDCVFSVPADENTTLKYDLCPLLTRGQYRVSRDVETPPSRTKVRIPLQD